MRPEKEVTTMWGKQSVLMTEHLELGPITENDRDAMIGMFYNDEIKQTYMIPDFAAREQAETLFCRMKAYCVSEDRFQYGVFLRGDLIGFLNDCEINGDAIELGYVIHPDYKGNGYATEALTAAIRELFRMGFSCVKAGFFEENPASGRVMEKSGMKKSDQTDEIEYRGTVHRCLYYEATKETWNWG